MSAYTPGPWGLTREGDVRSSHTRENGHASEYVATLKPEGYRFERIDEIVPNSRLIAAAPDLLEALQAANAIADSGESDIRGISKSKLDKMPRCDRCERLAAGRQRYVVYRTTEKR